jgi:cytochrome b561
MLRADEDGELRAFDPVIRVLHWLTLLLVATTFLLAFSIPLAPTKAAEGTLLALHRSFGASVWVVTLGRFVWRQFARFPDWPANLSQAVRFAARGSELALYALLLAQPILGALYTNAYGERVDLFWLGRLPALIGQDRRLEHRLGEAHRTVGLVLLALIGLHAAAALYRHFWRRDGTLRAMLPQPTTCRGGPLRRERRRRALSG